MRWRLGTVAMCAITCGGTIIPLEKLDLELLTNQASDLVAAPLEYAAQYPTFVEPGSRGGSNEGV